MLIINTDGHQGAIDTARMMWTISFHGSNHYSSIQLPGNPPLPIRHIKNVQRFQSYLQQALDKYQDDLIIISSMSCTKGHPISTIAVESLCKTTKRMMTYIALQILIAGGDAISELHLKSLLSQVKEGVMKSVQGDTAVSSQGASKETRPIANPAMVRYVAELKATIDKHHDSIFQLLLLQSTSSARGESAPQLQLVNTSLTITKIISLQPPHLQSPNQLYALITLLASIGYPPIAAASRLPSFQPFVVLRGGGTTY